MAVSTHDPPYEQWLAAEGVGAGSVVVVGWSVRCGGHLGMGDLSWQFLVLRASPCPSFCGSGGVALGTLVTIVIVPLVFIFPRIGRCSPVAILIAPLSTPLSPCRRRHRSTRDPPHEQLLMRLGAGSVHHCRSSIRKSLPCEQ
jgi:hypothetical protein